VFAFSDWPKTCIEGQQVTIPHLGDSCPAAVPNVPIGQFAKVGVQVHIAAYKAVRKVKVVVYIAFMPGAETIECW